MRCIIFGSTRMLLPSLRLRDDELIGGQGCGDEEGYEGEGMVGRRMERYSAGGESLLSCTYQLRLL